ncbi:MAG: hypothetical protein J5493_08540 [Lachnospiraceae bacterium]|nr:hypothetical protein [Lachnospiraceae bacterium]
MRKLTILVDMDGTIESLLDVWLNRLNKKYNRNVKFEDITSWDISKLYDGLSQTDVMNEVLDDSIWQEVQPINGAYNVLKKWIAEGHHVYIVTATPYQSLKAKMDDLLFRCFPFISWENVIITSNKQLLKCDVMIDDGIHNLIGGEYKKILFDAPYNRSFDDKNQV